MIVHARMIGLALLFGGCAASAPSSVTVGPVPTPAPVVVAAPGPEAQTPAPETPDPVRDADGDRIVDTDDRCPTETEVYNGSDDEDGCPDCARYIILTDAWELRALRLDASDTVVSTADLDFDVAAVSAHVEWTRIGVESAPLRGERDGAHAARRRAAVIEALVTRGIARERLVDVTPDRGATRVAQASPAATVSFSILESTGSIHPLCNDPFPGCRAQDAVPLQILDRVYFAARSSVISEQSGPIVDAVASLLVHTESLERVEVRGFIAARERGPGDLARARAEAVRDALVARGVSASRVVAVSGGVAARREDPDAERVVMFEILASARCRPTR